MARGAEPADDTVLGRQLIDVRRPPSADFQGSPQNNTTEVVTTTATAWLQLRLKKHYLFALSLHKPSLSFAQSLHGRLLLLLRLSLPLCSLARTVSSRFPPPPRLSSPVRYRTCVVMYTACFVRGDFGIRRGRPHTRQPGQTDRQNSVGLRSDTAPRGARRLVRIQNLTSVGFGVAGYPHI